MYLLAPGVSRYKLHVTLDCSRPRDTINIKFESGNQTDRRHQTLQAARRRGFEVEIPSDKRNHPTKNLRLRATAAVFVDQPKSLSGKAERGGGTNQSDRARHKAIDTQACSDSLFFPVLPSPYGIIKLSCVLLVYVVVTG